LPLNKLQALGTSGITSLRKKKKSREVAKYRTRMQKKFLLRLSLLSELRLLLKRLPRGTQAGSRLAVVSVSRSR
jgi:hypothetical protein